MGEHVCENCKSCHGSSNESDRDICGIMITCMVVVLVIMIILFVLIPDGGDLECKIIVVYPHNYLHLYTITMIITYCFSELNLVSHTYVPVFASQTDAANMKVCPNQMKKCIKTYQWSGWFTNKVIYTFHHTVLHCIPLANKAKFNQMKQ